MGFVAIKLNAFLALTLDMAQMAGSEVSTTLDLLT
jgi:hypothetical protein